MSAALGENGRITVAGAILCVRRATVTEDPAEISTTCTESGGFNTRTRGPRNITVDVEAQWDHESDPFSGPPKIEAGTYCASVVVIPNKDDAPAENWYLTTAYVATCGCVIDAEGVQTYTIQFKNQGFFYTPARPGP